MARSAALSRSDSAIQSFASRSTVTLAAARRHPRSPRACARARVTAFDTDAWQRLDAGLDPRRITPDALAPEQLRSQAHLPSIEADRWALAVAIVQILLDGRHPCDGVRPDGSLDLALVEDNVRDGYSHFSPVALRPVHGAPRLEHFSPRVRDKVEQAFGPGHLDPARRPDARAWVQALRDDADLTAERYA